MAAEAASSEVDAADPVELLRRLIAFDTSNPPGNEAACVEYLEGLLASAGLQTEIHEAAPGRPNLLARLRGSDGSSPLLLQGHVDVVPADPQGWSRKPFEGVVADSCVWGRGALDMKGGVAMLVAACVRLAAAGEAPPHDLILAIVADEENGSELGARFLVEQHPELFAGVRWALGEFGGFSMDIGGRRFYPIQVAEKRRCRVLARIRGTSGHGAFVTRGGTMQRLGRLLTALDERQPPPRLTPVVRELVETIARTLPHEDGERFAELLDPRTADRAARNLAPHAKLFEAMVRTTVTATIVRGGDAPNVVPGEAHVILDVRVLPDASTEEAMAEIADIVGSDVELEVIEDDRALPPPDLSQLEVLGDVLRELDPEAVPVPLLQVGGTDGRHFARLGIQTYGFLPLRLPGDFDFLSLVHAADERVPVDALRFGAEAVFRAVTRL